MPRSLKSTSEFLRANICMYPISEADGTKKWIVSSWNIDWCCNVLIWLKSANKLWDLMDSFNELVTEVRLFLSSFLSFLFLVLPRVSSSMYCLALSCFFQLALNTTWSFGLFVTQIRHKGRKSYRYPVIKQVLTDPHIGSWVQQPNMQGDTRLKQAVDLKKQSREKHIPFSTSFSQTLKNCTPLSLVTEVSMPKIQ